MTGVGEVTAHGRFADARGWRVALLLLAAISFVFVRVPLISVPLERDEGEYAYIAQRMLAGDVPYRDAFDQKPPATFFVYAAVISIFGNTIEAIHGFMYAWTALSVWLLHACVRRRGGADAAAFAALIYAVASASPAFTGNAANTEIFMSLPMIASWWCLLRALASARPGGWWLLAGAAAGAACWFKQVAVTNALFVAGVALHAQLGGSARDWRGAGLSLASLLAGALLVSAPVLLGFAAAGAFGPFVDAVFLHNLEYSQSVSWRAGLEVLMLRLGMQAPGLWAVWALAALAVLAAPRLGFAGAGFWFGCFIAAALGVSTGLFFRPHYFLQALPALAALAGLGAAVAVSKLGASGGRARAAAWGAVVAVLLVPPAYANREILREADPLRISRRIYGANPFVESLEIAAYIERSSSPDDTVLIVGSEPQILFYANRRSATRYIFFYPLTGNYPDVRARQRSVVAEIRRERPRYVVWSNLQSSLLLGPETEPLLFEFTNDLLRREYRLELLAHPVAKLAPFEFLHGSEARKLLRQAGERAEAAPFVAVYRRLDD